jgi:hypothetical protein
MDQIATSIDLSELNHRTDEQINLIEGVLKELKPLQTKMLGDKTVRAISKGATFEAIQGGRHLNFMEVIGVLSNLATLTQIVVLAVVAIRKLRANAAWKAEYQEEVKKAVTEKIRNHVELSDLSSLIASDHVILDRIIEKITTAPGSPALQ